MQRPPHQTPLANPRKGFALIITISLLAFLVLLLVSLATLTRVETQVAGNHRDVDRARQNALLALNIAMGELQKYAGPDQRITAPADLIASTDRTGANTPAPAAKAIVVQPGTRRWTGVWGNGQSEIGYDLRPDQISGRGVTPVLLNWLVSGNEGSGFTLSGSKGGVTAGPPQAATPTVPGANVVPLVGANTAGESVEDWVSAPLVDIAVPAGLTPGTNPGATIVGGRYAWWVGDEGVKARVNLQPGYIKSSDPAEKINAFLVSQRSALELMDRDNSATPLRINAKDDAHFNFTHAGIPKINSLAQLGFLETGGNVLNTATKARFHDITMSSCGVISDTYAGGLKRNLTADIADITTTANNPAGDRPADSEPLFKVLKNNAELVPTWGHLRSWARLHPDATGAIAPVLPSATHAGFNPMLMYASIGLDVYVDGAAPPYTVHAAFFPIVLLNNPYPVSIAASRYRIGFKFSPTSPSLFEIKTSAPGPVDAQGQPTPPPNANNPNVPAVGFLDLGAPAFSASSSPPSSPGNLMYFVIDCPPIPPGETHAFRLDEAETPYMPGLLMKRFPAEDAGMPTGVTNHAYVSTSLTLPVSVKTDHHLALLRSPGAGFSCSIFFGADDDLSLIDNRYQSYAITVIAPTAGGTQSGVPAILDTPASPNRQRISSNWHFPGGTNGARAALRLNSPIEGGQHYSTLEECGISITANNKAHPGVAWLRHGNLRAPYTRRTSLEATSTGTGIIGVVLANDKISQPYRNGRSVELVPQLTGYATGIMGSDDDKILRRMTLFDILETPDRFLSLGQLQNAPFARYGFHPAYPFANAMADLRIPRTATYVGSTSDSGNSVGRPDGSGISDPIYDLSWHLNRALWDRYFIAGTPEAVTWDQAAVDDRKAFLNNRHTYYQTDSTQIPIAALKYTGAGSNLAYEQAAANLLVAGAFNINSTSEQAWRAVLGGPLGMSATNASDYAYSTGPGTGDRIDEIVPYPRFSRRLYHSAASEAGYPIINTTMTSDSRNLSATTDTFRSTLYQGNRGLWLADGRANTTNKDVNAVIDELARNIVAEIRERGPFLSLSDFINRPILSTKQTAGLKGALQDALDSMPVATTRVNPYDAWKKKDSTGSFKLESFNALPTGWDVEHFLGGPKNEVGTRIDSPGNDLKTAFAPKYLTQADLLSTLGPHLSARSDTFMIRTYGESLNPVTQAKEGRAWCEAIVQRVPDYVDASQRPEAKAGGLNATLGRKFKIVSFRWLGPQDL